MVANEWGALRDKSSALRESIARQQRNWGFRIVAERRVLDERNELDAQRVEMEAVRSRLPPCDASVRACYLAAPAAATVPKGSRLASLPVCTMAGPTARPSPSAAPAPWPLTCDGRSGSTWRWNRRATSTLRERRNYDRRVLTLCPSPPPPCNTPLSYSPGFPLRSPSSPPLALPGPLRQRLQEAQLRTGGAATTHHHPPHSHHQWTDLRLSSAVTCPCGRLLSP